MLKRILSALALLCALLPEVAGAQQLPAPMFRTPAVTDNSNRAATTAIVRTMFGPIANAIWYGADPSGAADSCTAFSNAVAYLKAQSAVGGKLYLPAGNYTSSCAISFSDMNFYLAGDGANSTKITFTTLGNAGVKGTLGSGYFRTGGSGFQLIPGAALANDAAISLKYPIGISPDQTVSFHDFIVQNGAPAANASAYFGTGVDCTACTGSAFSNWRILGRNEGTFDGSGISATNMKACFAFRSYSSNVNVNNGECDFAQAEFIFSGGSEGQKITNTNGLAVNWCFVNEDSTTNDPASAGYFPGPLVHTNHCDSFQGGAKSKGWSLSIYQGNQFFKRPDSTADWIGYDLANGTYASDRGGLVGNLQTQVTGGQCFAGVGQAGTATCVRFGSLSQYNLVQGVAFQGMTWFSDHSSSAGSPASGNNTVRNNTAMQPGVAGLSQSWSRNRSPLNTVTGNLPGTVGTEPSTVALDANSNNPNVGGFNQRQFVTANTAAQGINSFANGRAGEVITVRIGDANTYFVNDPANLLLSGGVTTGTLRPGQVFTFLRDGTIWRETARTN